MSRQGNSFSPAQLQVSSGNYGSAFPVVYVLPAGPGSNNTNRQAITTTTSLTTTTTFDNNTSISVIQRSKINHNDPVPHPNRGGVAPIPGTGLYTAMPYLSHSPQPQSRRLSPLIVSPSTADSRSMYNASPDPSVRNRSRGRRGNTPSVTGSSTLLPSGEMGYGGSAAPSGSLRGTYPRPASVNPRARSADSRANDWSAPSVDPRADGSYTPPRGASAVSRAPSVDPRANEWPAPTQITGYQHPSDIHAWAQRTSSQRSVVRGSTGGTSGPHNPSLEYVRRQGYVPASDTPSARPMRLSHGSEQGNPLSSIPEAPFGSPRTARTGTHRSHRQ